PSGRVRFLWNADACGASAREGARNGELTDRNGDRRRRDGNLLDASQRGGRAHSSSIGAVDGASLPDCSAGLVVRAAQFALGGTSWPDRGGCRGAGPSSLSNRISTAC